ARPRVPRRGDAAPRLPPQPGPRPGGAVAGQLPRRHRRALARPAPVGHPVPGRRVVPGLDGPHGRLGRRPPPPLPLAGRRLPAGGPLRAAPHRPPLGGARRVHPGQRESAGRRRLPGRLGVGGVGSRGARPGLLHARLARPAAAPGGVGLRPAAVAGRASADLRGDAAGRPHPRLLPGAGRLPDRPVRRRRPHHLPDPPLARLTRRPAGPITRARARDATIAAMRRILLATTAGLVWLGVTAAPASAHSVSGVSATNFHTHLTSVTPRPPGLEVTVIEAARRPPRGDHTGQTIV